MLITIRRTVAVLLALPLLIVVAVGLLGWQLDRTVLSAGYLKGQAAEAGLYDDVYDEAVDATVDAILEDEAEWLPEELEGVELPEDAASRARLRSLIEALVPPEELRRNVESVIDGFVPWLTGREESFDIRLSIHQGFRQAFASQESQPSLFEETWRELGMSELAIRALSETTAGDGGDDPGGEPTTIDVLGEDLPAASAWLDDQVGTVVDAMAPYLLGESEHFEVAVSFDEYPALAVPLADPLESTPEDLLRHGWSYSDADVRERIGEGADEVEAEIDRRLALFRPEGFSFTDDDLLERIEEERATATTDEDAPPDLATMRTWAGHLRLAGLWGSPLIVAVLVVAIGVLGGRRGPSRLAWAAGAAGVAALVVLGVATVGYGMTVGPAVEDQVAEFRAQDDTRVAGPIRDELAARFEGTVDGIAGGVALWAGCLASVAAVALAGAYALHRQGRRAHIALEMEGPLPGEAR